MTVISRRLLQLAACVVVAGTLISLAAALAGTGRLNHVSGVWITLAVDLADGVFYRPLYSEHGYGGTRFFPLHFVLHAGMLRLGVATIAAGYVITLASAAAMIGAIYAWLRRLGVPRTVALPLALAGLGSATAGLAVTTIRADLLPAALNLWALCWCTPKQGRPPRRTQLLAAAALFVLAFSAKVTTVFGLAAAVAAALHDGRAAQARLLAAVTLPGWVLVLVLLHLASTGRATESLLVCASGGATFTEALHGPFRMLAGAASNDFVCLAAGVFATAGLLWPRGAPLDRVPVWAFGATALVTAVIFGSPGTDYNHLLDLYAVSLVCIGTVWSKNPLVAAWMAPCLSLVLVVGVVLNTRSTLRAIDQVQSGRVAILERLRDGTSPTREQLLSQDPMVPLLLGQRPLLMDPFMLRLSRRHDPRITDDLWARLHHPTITAVVLMVDPTSTQGRLRLHQRHFGPGFAEELLEHYSLEGRYGMYYLYRPRSLVREAIPVP